ncbi:MAG: hypothetical protein Q8Q23_05240 [bacterium]|nr:hypothetical protein [bacterium]
MYLIQTDANNFAAAKYIVQQYPDCGSHIHEQQKSIYVQWLPQELRVKLEKIGSEIRPSYKMVAEATNETAS